MSPASLAILRCSLLLLRQDLLLLNLILRVLRDEDMRRVLLSEFSVALISSLSRQVTKVDILGNLEIGKALLDIFHGLQVLRNWSLLLLFFFAFYLPLHSLNHLLDQHHACHMNVPGVYP